MSFPTYAKVFSKVTTQSSLKLLSSYPLAGDMLGEASKDDIVGEPSVARRRTFWRSLCPAWGYDAIIAAAQDAAVFGRGLFLAMLSASVFISILTQEYQKHLDAPSQALHETVGETAGYFDLRPDLPSAVPAAGSDSRAQSS